jgi:hypothetical protein
MDTAREMPGFHGAKVEALSFNANGSLLVSVGGDNR